MHAHDEVNIRGVKVRTAQLITEGRSVDGVKALEQSKLTAIPP